MLAVKGKNKGTIVEARDEGVDQRWDSGDLQFCR